METIEKVAIEFEKALLQIDRIKASEIFEEYYVLERSFNSLEKLCIQSLEDIGASWEAGTISLAQVYMSGVICEELIDRYLPKMQVERKNVPRMAIAVLLDHHALGKRIVSSILRSGGFEVLDFGQGLSVEELVEKTIEGHIEILLISTLMLSSALKIKEVKEQLTVRGANPKIIVGGAPFRFDKNLWQTVGADADGKKASNIIETIEALQRGVE
jgi:methanogenic corrinoid protein MtbC1